MPLYGRKGLRTERWPSPGAVGSASGCPACRSELGRTHGESYLVACIDGLPRNGVFFSYSGLRPHRESSRPQAAARAAVRVVLGLGQGGSFCCRSRERQRVVYFILGTSLD
jgi:hypothetical protein